MYKRFIAGLLLATSANALAHSHASKDASPWDGYQKLAEALNAKIKTADLQSIKQDAAELTRLSKVLMPAFIARQPICTDYINTAVAAADSMLEMSLDDIERDYHADGKLPPMKSATCYHAKDLLVHPATVSVIARTLEDNAETREKLHHELEEVLEHFSEVRRDAGL